MQSQQQTYRMHSPCKNQSSTPKRRPSAARSFEAERHHASRWCVIATAAVLLTTSAGTDLLSTDRTTPSDRQNHAEPPATSGPAATTSASRLPRRTSSQRSSTISGDTNDPCQTCEHAITAATTSLDQAEAFVALGECILVRRCASPLTNRCYGAPPDGTIRRQAEQAVSLLDRASAALELASTQVDPEVGDGPRDRIEMLRTFARVFAALDADAASPEAKEKLLEACSHLATYLDDEDPKVVESARLWQGLAYRFAGRPQRACQVLRPTLAAPADPRIGLMVRLQQCLALSDGGQHAAAVALCLRLAVRVESWFAEEDTSTRKQATDTVRLVQAEVLLRWADQLRDAGLTDRAAHATGEARKLLGPDSRPVSADQRLGLVESIAGLTIAPHDLPDGN